MRANRIWLPLLICAALQAFQLKADEPAVKWLRNLDDAKRIAQMEKKDLLINFTGLSWCVYCKRLEAEVFSKPEFAVAAQEFVPVEIDYPGNVERLEGEMKEWFPKVRDRYMVAGYPTVVIADSAGLPVAYTGYNTGITPAKFLKGLATYRAGRQARDEALAEAATLTGAARAKRLDEALKAVNLNLGSMYSRKVDPLFAFYGNVVDEIKSLDGESGELAKYYETRTATRQAWDQQPGVAIFKELERYRGIEDSPAAIEYIEQMLANVDDEDLRWRLELARQHYTELSSARKDTSQEEQKLICENALANARRLLSLSPPTDDIRERLLGHEAFMLQRLLRTGEMVDVYDRLIRDAANNPAKRLGFLRRKGTALIRQPDVDRALAALRDYQVATEPKSKNWRDATTMILYVLQQAKRPAEAIEYRKQMIELDPEVPGLWLGLARDQQAVGLTTDARKSLDEAERKVPGFLAKKGDAINKEQQARFEEEIAKLRKLVGPDN